MPSTPDNNQIKQNPEKIRINPEKLTWLLCGVAVIMALISLFCQYLTYTKGNDLTALIKLVDVDTELSLPTIYSVFLLFLGTCLLAFIAFTKQKSKERFVGAWVLLTLGFLFLTFDEGASIHEKLMAPISSMLGGDVPTIFYFSWVIPALVVVAALGVLFLNFLKRLPSRTRLGFLLAAALYLGGSLGMELVGGNYTSQFGMDNLGFNILATIEESMEMFGSILFIRTLMDYIRDIYPSIELHFSK